MEGVDNQNMGTRWDQSVEETGAPPPFPRIVPGTRWVIDAFHDLAFCSRNGWGEFPLPFAEIEAYGRASGGLDGRSILLLHKMSVAYCIGRQRGADPFELPRWSEVDEEGKVVDEEELPELEVVLIDWETDVYG